MTKDELRNRAADLSIWTRGSERAPHKPLLLLWSLGRCSSGKDRLASYAEVDEALRPLLEEFGPPRRSYHTEYPFWYLRNDGLWEVRGVEEAKVREGKASQPTKGELLRVDAAGGLVTEAYEILRSDPELLEEIAGSSSKPTSRTPCAWMSWPRWASTRSRSSVVASEIPNSARRSS